MTIHHHLIFIYLITYITTQDTRFVFEMFRHGARTPTDNLDSSSRDWFGFQWSGIKELTNVGLRQSYLTGYSNYIKYVLNSKLLSPQFDPRELYLVSTDSHRTILTANAHLQGLYPPGTGANLSEWQMQHAVPPNNVSSIINETEFLGNNALPYSMNIIPIHAFFPSDRYIQLQDKRVCPGMTGYYEKTQSTNDMKALLKELDEKYGESIMKVAPNFKKGMFLKYEHAYSILDDVICADVDGRDFSEFERNGINRKEIVDYAYRFFITDFYIVKESRNKVSEMSMSPIFTQIKKWMDDKIALDKKGKDDYRGFDMPRMVMYSAHDSTLAVFNYFMEYAFGTSLNYPDFASRVHLELMRDEADGYYVNYLFNETLVKRIEYDEFSKQLSKVLRTKDEVVEFCRFVDDEEKFNYYSLITIVLIIVALSLVVGIIHVMIKGSKPTGMKEQVSMIEDKDVSFEM